MYIDQPAVLHLLDESHAHHQSYEADKQQPLQRRLFSHSGGLMARKEIRMEELMEVLYQTHQGRNITQIKRSLGLDRKTIRKYRELAEPYGFSCYDEAKDDLYYT